MLQVRHAFTIWELLVVIVIVLFLAGWLLPQVNQSRGGGGRKSVCINNQRQIALALYQYEQAFGHYPGYVMPQATVDTEQGVIASRPVSWAFAIMSRLERSDISDNYGGAAPAGATVGPFARPDHFLRILVCPSDPSVVGNSSPALSYVVNTGLKDPEPEISMPNGKPRDWPENGIFHFHYPYAWKNDFDVPLRTQGDLPNSEAITKVSAKFISDHDSLARTLMLSENVDSGQWTDALEHEVGFYWQATQDGKAPQLGNLASDDWLERPLLNINEQASNLTEGADRLEQRRYGRPSSFHPGGVIVGYADAHVTMLNNDIDYLVYCQLMTPHGAASGPAGPKGMNSGQRILFKDQPADRAKFATRPIDEDSL